MADQRLITVYPGDASPKDIIVRALPVADVPAGTTIWLYAGDATAKDIVLRDPTVLAGAGPSFPTQFAGLRYFNGSVKQLALVALADAPSGMGAVWRIRKNGTDYAVYLVETSDPNASEIRLRTSAGTKAARLLT